MGRTVSFSSFRDRMTGPAFVMVEAVGSTGIPRPVVTLDL